MIYRTGALEKFVLLYLLFLGRQPCENPLERHVENYLNKQGRRRTEN